MNELAHILNYNIDNKAISTLLLKKLLIYDTNNLIELYAWSVSQIQVTKKLEILKEKIIKKER